MKGGEIYFRDPRGPAVAMYETPAIELPWIGSGPGIPITPTTGKLLLFPSWLEHRVEPFEARVTESRSPSTRLIPESSLKSNRPTTQRWPAF